MFLYAAQTAAEADGKISALSSRESPSGSVPSKFRKDTRFAGIALYVNNGRVAGGVTELRDIRLEEVAK